MKYLQIPSLLEFASEEENIIARFSYIVSICINISNKSSLQ